jgi:acyl-CoA thioester hydrolase
VSPLVDRRFRVLILHRYDSVVNTYLITQCGLHPPTSSQYGLVVHSHSDFFGSIAFPAVAELCLRVNKLGKSSVTYEIALFEKGVDAVKAVGEFVHVFVDRASGRPSASGMNDSLKRGLEKILVRETSKL